MTQTSPKPTDALPSQPQIALIRAAMGRSPVLGHWKDYLSLLGAQAPDEGEKHLFSMVWQHLSAEERAAPEAARLRLHFRRAAVRQQLILETASHVNAVLDDVGVTPIFIKGCALQARAYGSDILRPMSDIDIVIAPEELPDVCAAAQKSGWVRSEERTKFLPVDVLRSINTKCTIHLPTGIDLDVHWVPRSVMEFAPSSLEAYRKDSREVHFGGSPWRVPSDDWLLLETLDHGLAKNQVAPVRWAVDALTVIGQPDFAGDWSKISGLAEQFRISQMLLTGLRFLREEGADVPQSVIDDLAAIIPTRLERIEMEFRHRHLPRPLQGIVAGFSHFFLRSRETPLRKLMKFPRFYRRNVLSFARFSDMFANIPAWIKGQ